jgi:hypothetical protein
MSRIILIVAAAVGLSGCVSTVVGATTGADVGTPAAVEGTTAKVGATPAAATARAIIPGDSKKDD